jgi:hypothetical protein
VDPGCLSALERGDRARPQLAVLGDQGAVEVAGDRCDRAGKRVGKRQPEVLSTT